MAEHAQSEFAPTPTEIDASCKAFRDTTPGRHWPSTLPMSLALEAANKLRDAAQAPTPRLPHSGIALWAPGVGYYTGRADRDIRRWSPELREAKVYPNLKAAVAGLVTGDGDHMVGVELRRIAVIPAQPTLSDAGAVT